MIRAVKNCDGIRRAVFYFQRDMTNLSIMVSDTLQKEGNMQFGGIGST